MRVLAVVAHPDDEVLGCGATLARHGAAGDEVRVLILSGGAMSRRGASSAEADALRLAAHHAGEILGASTVETGGFQDQRFDAMSLLDLIRWIEDRAQAYQPEWVYTHSKNDLNRDHRLVHDAVVTAFRPLPGCSVKRLLACEVPGSTGVAFAPDVYVDVAQAWPVKVQALECYTSEMRAYPHPRSLVAIDALSRVRGSQAGLERAEAFELIREIR